MPLILISGYPSSGKTHRSKQLIDFFQSKISASTDPSVSKLKVIRHDDQSLGISRDVYATARSEKDARAAFSSAIKRDISRDTIVIADGMNYIKGFRYQLYCEAKAVETPSCVVHIGTPIPTCRTLNTSALESQTSDGGGGGGGYEPALFDNLVFRYEEPNGMTRWDSPLFTVAHDDATPPSAAIWDAMVGADGGQRKTVKPNAATVLRPATEQNYLYELDKATSEIVAAVAAWERDHTGEGGGGEVAVEGVEALIELPGEQAVSLPQLQRLKRQFVQLNRTHEIGKARIKSLFVDYLNDALQN